MLYFRGNIYSCNGTEKLNFCLVNSERFCFAFQCLWIIPLPSWALPSFPLLRSHWILRLRMPASRPTLSWSRAQNQRWAFPLAPFQARKSSKQASKQTPHPPFFIVCTRSSFVSLLTLANKCYLWLLQANTTLSKPIYFWAEFLIFFFPWPWRFCVAEVFYYFNHFHSRIALVTLLPGKFCTEV